jgi:hypothetical protein
MRIRELLENKNFNDSEFIEETENRRELNFDLVEDLVYFMNHNDDVYRRHVYPSIANCLDRFTANRPTNASLFKPAVDKSYQIYVRTYPIRELPEHLDDEVLNSVYKKLHEDFKQHMADGKYED